MKLKGRIILYIAVIVLSALLVSTVSAKDGGGNTIEAQQFTYVGAGAAIPDNTYDGTIGSMACSAVDTSGLPAQRLVRNVRLKMKVTHTWAGDLAFKLVSSDGTELGLMHRPGATNVSDGDDAGLGNNSDLLGNAIRFRDFGAKDAELMGDEGATVTAVDYVPNPEVIPGPLGLPALRGEGASGSWSFCVGDGAGGDTGTIDSWVLILDVSNGNP